MRVGLYFGSFNPIHIGHLIIANHVANEGLVDQVWFVVSPHNPLKPISSLLNEYHRLHLVQEAIKDDRRFKTSDIEFKLPKPSYTIDTLTYLSEKYHTHQFSVIMGGDSYSNLPKWKQFDVLIKNYSLIVYRRPDFEEQNIHELETKATFLDAPLLDISSTQIRNYIKKGKSVKYLLPEIVAAEIERNNYYK